MYIENHGIPRSIRLDQAKSLVGNQVTNFSNKNNIDIIEAPVDDHRAIGLVENSFRRLKVDLHVSKKKNRLITPFM